MSNSIVNQEVTTTQASHSNHKRAATDSLSQTKIRINFSAPICTMPNKNYSVNHLQSTPKEWFEQLQLIPVSYLNGKKAFDTYARIDPGSQFTFILDKITEFLTLPCKHEEANTLDDLNTKHDMPLSKISEQVTVAHYEKFGSKVSHYNNL